MRACKDNALYCMHVRDGLLKVGRSHSAPRRARELCARVVQIWPGMGHLEPKVHYYLDDFAVARELFDCPLQAVERVVEHCRRVDVFIKRS